MEAIVEDLTAKTSLFRTLETIVSETAVLATNTSSLSVTALASVCSHPERVIGLHFFNPAPLMALVEVVPALQSRPELTEEAMEEMAAWGKSPAQARDTPGSSSTVWHALYSEALRILEEGIATLPTSTHPCVHKGSAWGPLN